MITLTKYDNLNIQFDTDDDWDYLRALKEHFSHYAEGYRFSPKYTSGQWDGKISVFNSMKRTLPYGLFLEWLKWHKKEHSNKQVSIADDIKLMFKGIEPNYTKDLLYYPYDYQDDCISSLLKISKGIVRVATAGGKSVLICYILKALIEHGLLDKALLIVPSIGLVTQFFSDMQDYGMDTSYIGKVADTWKEWDNKIVISTWQSLNNVPEKMKEFNVVIVDEVHSVTGKCLRDLMSLATSAQWRFGVTGTMPESELSCLQVMSYIGPIVREYGSKKLSDLGYVAKCNIKIIHVDYNNKPKGEYNEVKDEVFNNSYRLGLITHLIKNCDRSILLLVGKVEDEGVKLQKYLETQGLDDREICFLSGKDKAKEREIWRKYTNEQQNIVLICTYQIFQQGINIPSLKYLILASPFKSKIRVLQSLGRIMRNHADKTEGATMYDIYDNVKHLNKHGEIRIKHYAKENFDMEDIFLLEGERPSF